ncbi:MAG: MG2 domain-containing protein [Deltaproteobacteria bacterium]|nr:MG2 domain-containing protein [Deltaproteobacteria bacterium]
MKKASLALLSFFLFFLNLSLDLNLNLGLTLWAQESPRVEKFTPQGTVKNIRQVRAQFSEPMVPFGEPRDLAGPFTVSCPEKGTARWADPKNWVYDFEKDLPAGIRCEFTLTPGLKTLSGKEIGEAKTFAFSTGGPAVRDSIPNQGNDSIDEEQVFILRLDAEPDPESVLQNVSFSVEGLAERVGIALVEGKDRKKILESGRARWISRNLKESGHFLLLIQSRQRFPNKAKVDLVWGKGVQTKTGVATERDQVLPFKARDAFSVVFRCQRENPRSACLPITPMTLDFSAPVPAKWARQIVLKGPEEKAWKPQLPEEEGDFFNGITFPGPFPENAAFRVELPAGLKDEVGRPLVNADKFPLSVRTDRYPPLAKFSSRFGIIELNAEPALPVTLRNLEPQVKGRMVKVDEEPGIFGRVLGKILSLPPDKKVEVQSWLRKVAAASREKSILSDEPAANPFQVPKPQGAQAFEVVGIPIPKPGLYIVELESTILGQALLDPPRPMYVPAAALVTNLSVHFKWAGESSLVWVTTLDKGEPVKDALVTVRDCQEKILREGKTDAEGLFRIPGPLPSGQDLPRCDHSIDSRDYPQAQALHLQGGLLVMAQTQDDMAFVHSGWNQGIEPWRFQLPYEDYQGPVMGHTVFDRTLLRAGQTVNMKHILRQRTTQGFSPVAEARRPDLVSIQHGGSGEKYEFPLKWDAQGIAETTWAIPRDAKLGNYNVVLVKKGGGERRGEWRRSSGEFRVEEFRVPLLRGTIKPPAEPLVKSKEVPLDLSVQYLAGGGASLLPVKLRSEVRPRSIPPFEGFDRFVFSNGPVKEGLVRRGAAFEDEETDGEETVDERKGAKIPAMDLVLDRAGSARTALQKIPSFEIPMEILTEMEFKDPNGEIQTISTRMPLWPSRYLIGIKPDSWAVSKDTFKFHVAVLDLRGKPVAGARVKTEIFQRKIFTHRKRIAGGFYSYDHTEETQKVASLCSGKTDSKGLLICETRSPVSGNLIVQAQTADPSGLRAAAQQEIWVAEKDDWWFAAGDHDRIDLLPERKRYEPGETAVFQVRMPFREATALVTVEREGVMESWVRKISGKKPVIEVPVKGNYAPNVFVSVFPVRGRVTDVKPTALVDLGRPAYKLGIAEINVGWREHELKVDVSADRKVYRVRQKARVKVAVKTWDGKVPPAGSEVAIAAVDEGLLELMPNQSWKILPAMMGRRGYGVRTATAQGQVIGRRHFGLKALPQGGGGGKQTTRELFDTLLLWKGRLPLDANGEASLEIPLNDSLTRFQIVAVATGGTGLFGNGSTSIQSTQDLMVFSGLPPLVREGDRFQAEFTLRNATSRNMAVDLSASVRGISGPFKSLSASLKPGEAKEVGWEATVPRGVETLQWEVEAQEKGSPDKDRLRISQKVVPAVPVRTFQATLTQVEKDFQISVERPADALPGRGGVNVNFRPRLAESMNGVNEYMKRYPYGCMEQRISVAVSLRDEKRWKDLMAQLPSYQDADGLVKYFPAMRLGDETLTSYILAIGHEAGWSIPEEPKERMEAGLRKFIEGRIFRGSPLPTVDLALRKLAAMEALSRGGKFEGKLLGSVSIEPNLWPTSAVIDWLNLLRNSRDIPNRAERLREGEDILFSRLNFQGTTMSFSTERSDCLWWLMVSGDVNAVRAVLALLRSDRWKEDMPRLVQGALARQRQGKWDLTLANAWGVLAMEKFSRAFETVAVSGTTRAELLTRSQSIDWKALPKGKTSSFPWPEQKGDLTIIHQGSGKPWVTVQSLAAIPLKEPLSSGYKIQKTVTPLQRKDANRWSRGDILRVRLEMEGQADQTWVVVSDPIPAGSSILGSGLGRDSQLLTQEEKKEGWGWPAYEERSFEAFRAYYRYVPKGKWTVEYTLRLNQSGAFQIPTTRTESLYFPEMFGEIPNRIFEVQP